MRPLKLIVSRELSRRVCHQDNDTAGNPKLKRIKLEEPVDECSESHSEENPTQVEASNGSLDTKVKAELPTPPGDEADSARVGLGRSLVRARTAMVGTLPTFKAASNNGFVDRAKDATGAFPSRKASKSLDSKSNRAVSTTQLKEMAGFVVKHLTPFLRGSRIASKVG